MTSDKTESDGVVRLPILGTIGPDRRSSSPDSPVGDPAHINPLDASTVGVMAKVLASGEVSHNPLHRSVQLEWANAVLWSDHEHTPYRIAMACRIIEAFSRDQSEVTVAEIIRKDMQIKIGRLAPLGRKPLLLFQPLVWIIGLALWALIALAVAGYFR